MTIITIYRFTGKLGLINIPKYLCEECDLSIATVRRLTNEKGMKKVKIEVKSWFKNFFEVILKGGWHAPVVLINGKIYTQGKVPDYFKLKRKIQKLL